MDASVFGWLAKTYIHHLWKDSRCCLYDQLGAVEDKDGVGTDRQTDRASVQSTRPDDGPVGWDESIHLLHLCRGVELPQWPKVTHEPITRIISKQLDIKVGPFTKEELDPVLRKIKNRKAAGLDEITPEVWKTRQFDDILLWYCNAVYNQNPIDRWIKGCILPFPKKGDLGLAKNYRGITLTSIAAKIYNALLRNRIEPKTDNILRKNQNGFLRNRSKTSQILTIRRILKGVRAKNLHCYLLTLPRPSIPYTEGRRNK